MNIRGLLLEAKEPDAERLLDPEFKSRVATKKPPVVRVVGIVRAEDLGFGLRLLLGLGQCQLALQIRDPAFPLLDLVELLSHKSLYNMNPIRMLGRDYADSSFSVQHLFAAGRGAGVDRRLQIG